MSTNSSCGNSASTDPSVRDALISRTIGQESSKNMKAGDAALKSSLRLFIQPDQQPEQSAKQSASEQQASCLAPVEIATIPIATTANNRNAF